MQDTYLGVKDPRECHRWQTLCHEIGHRVEIIGDNEQARERLNQHVPDFFITDVEWLEQNFDHSWMKSLKGSRKVGYWIVLGPDDVALAVRWIKSGADTYVSTKWSDEQIKEILTRLHEEEPVLSPLVSRKDLVLLQVIREISRNLDDLETLLNLSMDATLEISRSDYGSILIYQPDIGALEVRQQRGPSEPVDTTWGLFGFTQTQLMQWLSEGEPRLIVDREQYETLCEQPNPDVRTMVIAPVLDGPDRLGLILLAKSMDTKDMYSRLEVDIIRAFVQDLAPVIRNAMVHARTQALNYKDDLTDAFNRRYFEQYLPEEIKRSERYGTNLSIIFLDLDNLKGVNEKFGHLMGSKTLQEIAHRMILAVRGSDRVVRYGGDEFCIILPETDIEGAQQVAERIRQEIISRPFLTAEGLGIQITASFGIATFPTHGRTKDELVEAADRAMYEIKMTSKNAIKVAEPIGKTPSSHPTEASP